MNLPTICYFHGYVPIAGLVDNYPNHTILQMTRKAFVLLVFVTGLFAPAMAASTDTVDFTIVNRLQFSVPANWTVIESKSTSEKTIFAFQIPNAGDEGTSDSSNLSIIATDLKTAQDKDAFEKQATRNVPKV